MIDGVVTNILYSFRHIDILGLSFLEVRLQIPQLEYDQGSHPRSTALGDEHANHYTRDRWCNG
jgi:hypothetical protein